MCGLSLALLCFARQLAVSAAATSENILWCGGVTDRSANFRVESGAQTSDFFVLHNSSIFPAGRSAAVLSIQIQSGVTAIDAAPLPAFLSPSTTYYYGIQSEWGAGGRYGKFTTMPSPGTASSFSFAFASCARSGSESRVFSEIKRLQDEAEGSAAPHAFFLHMGDLFYEDIGENDVQMFRSAYKTVWKSPQQSELYRNKPLVYMWDDHDYGENDSNMKSESRPAAMKAYQMFVPHYPLAAPAAASASFDVPVYHAFTVGRVRFIVMDLRSMSEPADSSADWVTYTTKPTMLGVEQKEWLNRELANHASFGLVVLVSTKPWSGAPNSEGCCKWMNYPEERVEVAEMIKSNGVDNLVAVAGDAHMVAFDDGSNTDFAAEGGAGFPLLHSAPLAQVGSFKGGPYSTGCHAPEVSPSDWIKRILSFGVWQPDTSQFSVLEVTDSGGVLASADVCFKATGYRYSEGSERAEQIPGAVLHRCSRTAAPGAAAAGIMQPLGQSSAGNGECTQQAEATSNKTKGMIAVATIVLGVVLCSGLTCQYVVCKRVCCKDCSRRPPPKREENVI